MNELHPLQLPDGQTLFCRHRSFDSLTTQELHDLLLLRQSVLVVEQASSYPDLDGLDPRSNHLTLHPAPDLPPIGCARLLGPGLVHPDLDHAGPAQAEGGKPTVAFGRLVLAPDWRALGLGRLLVCQALAALNHCWPDHDTVIGAQLYLENFYASFGFVRISDVYDDGGIPHITMRRLS